jgi:hypothetical protein
LFICGRNEDHLRTAAEAIRQEIPVRVEYTAADMAVRDGHRTYVHCTAGLGRAPLTVLGYLTLVQGQDPEDAIRLILKGRPGAVPAWEAYHGRCQDLVGLQREAIERRAYDQRGDTCRSRIRDS